MTACDRFAKVLSEIAAPAAVGPSLQLLLLLRILMHCLPSVEVGKSVRSMLLLS